MANIVILGVYTSKTALDTAEAATASAGDTYLVGTKIPYDLYTFKSSAFTKGDKVSNVVSDLSTPVTIEDVTEAPTVTEMFGVTWKDGSKTYKLRQTVGRGVRQDTYELFGV